MGSSGSKASAGGASSSSGAGKRRGRSNGKTSVFKSCLSGSSASDFEEQENGSKSNAGNRAKSNSFKRKAKVEQSDDEMPCVSSSGDLDDWHQARITHTSASGAGSSSARASTMNSFLSRFNIVPGNVSFRLSRAASLGSSRVLVNDDSEIPMHVAPDRTESVHQRQPAEAPSGLLYLDNLRDNQVVSPAQNATNVGAGADVNVRSPPMFSDVDVSETRLFDRDRRIGLAREPSERNVRFSRTLSVGRLRDRVLRRSSWSEQTFCPLQQGRQTDVSGGDESRFPAASPSTNASSNTSSTPLNIQDHEMDISRPREARYHDLLEHRSNFLERRRRIRSQVRALQRLGSRFGNLSGHERSCILSGQHRTGHCTCHESNRESNTTDDNSTRASISRIVMLAEALFEVLDEIHQQSVVLSSRPSVSSIGSVPAPTEIVESLPVKVYTKSNKFQNDEAAQCYICLVEYEDGESMRILPCNHEFHRTCIDKWLKEIHRVCPLCRGDICRSDLVPSES